jgi:hypothetical protein
MNPKKSKKVILNLGIGDFVVLSSHLDFDSVDEIYWAAHAEQYARPLVSLVYPNIKQHHLASPGKQKAFWFFKDIPGADEIPGLEDWTVANVFAGLKSENFKASPLLSIDTGVRINFSNCVCVCPTSGNYQYGRDFTEEDWQNTIDQLERDNAIGIVLGLFGEVPEHGRLVNCMNRYTLADCITVMKQCKSYIGIDSCISILATQWFSNENLQIKTVNSWYNMHKRLFAAPKKTFEFISPKIRAADQPTPLPEDDVSDGNMSLRLQRLLGYIE